MENSKNKFGELMDIKYFIDIDFNSLHEKYIEIKLERYYNYCMKNKKENNKNINSNIYSNKNKRKKIKQELITLEDYDNYYLINGKFIYPDSIPYNFYQSN